jgi:hypothetical protein
MTPEQDFARIFGLTSVAAIAFVVPFVVPNNLRKKLSGWFGTSPYTTVHSEFLVVTKCKQGYFKQNSALA